MLLPLLLLLPSACLGLYADQAGTFDWYKAYVGHLQSATFHGTKPRLFVSSQQGVVGSLNLRDGSIQWRHLLQERGAPLATLLDAKKAFFTLNPDMLRAWDHQRGAVLWERPLSQGGDRYRPSMALLPGSPAAVAVMAGGQIQTFSVSDGTEKSSTSLDLTSVPEGAISQLQAGAADASIAGYAWIPGGSAITSFWVSGGSADAPQVLAAPQPLSSVSAVGAQGLAVLTADHQSICFSGFGANGPLSLECLAVSSFGPAAAAAAAHPAAAVQLAANAGGFGLAVSAGGVSWAALLKATQQGLQQLAVFEGASAISAGQGGPSGMEYTAVASLSDSGQGDVTLQYIDVRSGALVGRDASVPVMAIDRLAPGSSAPGLKEVVLGSFQKKDGKDGFRALLVWDDERISLVQQGVAVWARDEALAGVQASLFAELPASKDTTVDAAPPGSPAARQDFVQFMQMQVLSAKVQFQIARPDEVQQLTKLRGALSKRTQPTRDSRGFRKLILVATQSGKVAALHNGDGHTVWWRPFPRALAPQRLLQWQLFHDLTHAPRVAALHSSSSSSVLTVLNAHTGAALEQVQLPSAVDQVISIGTISAAEGVEQHVYMAVSLAGALGEAPRVHILPNTPDARELFLTQHRALFFWAESATARTAPSSTEAPALQGFGFDAAAAEAARSGTPIHAVPTWRLAFASPILALAARDPQEPTHSSVKVLGDRSIKYRYLNPNTVVVVTGTPPGVWVDPDAQDLVQATIYIIDSASGQVLHQQLQPYARGPAAAVITDNTAAVQLWDVSAAKFTLTSLELYDATPREFSVLDALFNPNATQPFTSFNPPPLEVLSASFFTRTPARAFGVTRTRSGITSKQLLARTTNDQVYAIDPRFIDPRRPKKAKLSAQEMEERLLPYQDTLPINSMGFVTLDKQVLGLRGTAATASRLESTSLIFNWGVDLQYTRVAPAKGFDTLDDDFNYGLLVTALVGLSTASLVAHYYTKRTNLAAKWT